MSYFTTERGKLLNKNIYWSAVYKGVNVLLSFLLIRESLQFFGADTYGIWLTVLSFFTWFSAIEVGISNSIRNKITTSLSDKDFISIKKLISKGYNSLSIAYGFIFTVFILALFILPIESLFITNKKSDFQLILIISTGLYFLHFILFYLHNILLATHFARTTYLITACQNALLLVGIFLFQLFDIQPGLFLICFWFSFVPFFTWLVTNIICFSSFLSNLSPFFNEFKFVLRRPFEDINPSFFIIQLCSLIIFTTDNVIIINYLGGSEVSSYHVIFKYFTILLVLFNLLIVPFWASFSEAYHKKDKGWILSNFKKLLKYWVGATFVGMLMLFFYKEAILLWINQDLEIPFSLALFTFISIFLSTWNSIFSYFLNSISKVELQKKLLIIMALLNIPLSIYLIGYHNSTGVIIATCISLLPLSIALPLECFFLLKKMPES